MTDPLLALVTARLGPHDHVHRYEDPDRVNWQPVNTAYVPADQFNEGTLDSWSTTATELYGRIVSEPAQLVDLFGVDPVDAMVVHERVSAKLRRGPVQDLRVDFEDGYRVSRPGAEDADVLRMVKVLHQLDPEGVPLRFGIRMKSLEPQTRERALRTLRLLIEGLADYPLLDRLVVTLPKVTSVAQVGALAFVCEHLEREHDLPSGLLRFEIQVETPRAIMDLGGRSPLPGMISAGVGRCIGLHYGTYDYSAFLGVAAAYQAADHAVADHAKAVMQVAAAGRGVVVVDGSTNRIAVGSDAEVRAAWRNHGRLVTRAMRQGVYQGWDIHPTMLPSRFAATYGFFRLGLAEALSRLETYANGGQAAYIDEPATVRALAAHVRRGLDCGAVMEEELGRLSAVRVRDLAEGKTE